MTESNFFGKNSKLDHIGIAVTSIKDVSPSSEIVIDHIQKVSIAFISANGVKFELLEPYGANSPIKESLKKAQKLLHICYAVKDIEGTIKHCKRHGFHCIAKPVPAVAFNGRKIAWVYSRTYGLFELLEKSRRLP